MKQSSQIAYDIVLSSKTRYSSDPPLFAGLSESDSDTCPFAKSQPTAEWTRTASIDVDSDIESLYPGELMNWVTK